MNNFPSFRVGIGYDVHRFQSGRKLFLGGIEIPHDQGLEGHSDADVLIHAVADALLGTIAAGDIGIHFPNTDDRWKGAPSTIFLKEIRKILDEKNATIVNIDASVIAEAPKLMPHREAMAEAMAVALGITQSQVHVKATTNEKLGFIGRREGISAMAVAMVSLPNDAGNPSHS